MSEVSLTREEFGPPDTRGRVTEVQDGPYTRRIVRDNAGRVIALEGRSRLDDVAEEAEALALRVRELEEDPGPEAPDLQPVIDALAQFEGRVLAAEGFVRVDDLLINERAVAAAAGRLGVRLSVQVEWLDVGDHTLSDRDGWYSYNPETLHTLSIRRGLDRDRTAYCIAHELAHASQLEKIGEGFLDSYRAATPEFEQEARSLAQSVADLELVREAHVPTALVRDLD